MPVEGCAFEGTLPSSFDYIFSFWGPFPFSDDPYLAAQLWRPMNERNTYTFYPKDPCLFVDYKNSSLMHYNGPPPSAAMWTAITAAADATGLQRLGFYAALVTCVLPYMLAFLLRPFIPKACVMRAASSCKCESARTPPPSAALRQLARAAAEAIEADAPHAFAALAESLFQHNEAINERGNGFPLDLEFILNAARLIPFLFLILSPDITDYTCDTPASLLKVNGFSMRTPYSAIQHLDLSHAVAADFTGEQLMALWALQYASPLQKDFLLASETTSLAIFLLFMHAAPRKLFYAVGALFSLILWALWMWWVTANNGIYISLWNSPYDPLDANANQLNQTKTPPTWQQPHGAELVLCYFTNYFVFEFVPLLHALLAMHFIYALGTPHAGSVDYGACARAVRAKCPPRAAAVADSGSAAIDGSGKA
jgi:hypothetical protein